MSLEQALNENVMVMRELIAAIKGMTTGVELASVAVCEEARTASTIPPGAVFVTPAPVADATAQEIAYFHDIAHRSVYKFGPTEPLNGVQVRCERIDEATYLKLKAEYAALTEAVLGKKPVTEIVAHAVETPASPSAGSARGEVIANPTQATAAASTPPTAPVVAAHVSAPVTPATPDWAKEVIPALMALAKKPATGQRHVQALLAEFGCAGKTVPAMQGLGKHAEIIASAQRRLASDEGL